MKIEAAELGLANAHRVRQHGLEYRLELARRTGNDLQHLRGRGLLLQRLGEFLFQVGVGCAKGVNVSYRLRSARAKLAAARWAICAFKRQRSPRRHSHWSPFRSASQGSSPAILTERRDELAALHSITSSARASTLAGISMPSALAALRLMISSYLVGACTGR